MDATRRRRAVATLLITGLLSGAVASAAAKPYRIAGAAPGVDRKWAPVEVLEETQAGVSCQLKYLDAAGRRSILASSLGTSLDIFPARDGGGAGPDARHGASSGSGDRGAGDDARGGAFSGSGARASTPAGPAYLVFVLEMINRTAEDVTFNPSQSRLATEKGDMRFALDYTATFERLRMLGEGAPGVDDLAKVLFDRVVTLRPGGSVRKLLVFEAPRDDRFRTMQVRLVEVAIGTSGVDFVFPFRKFAL